MCRFVAYMGKKKSLLGDVIQKPPNSLIVQSRDAREIEPKLNADGLGIAWYDHSLDDIPGLYRSTLPAWNDRNFTSLITKIRSNCFIGHVRGAILGDVGLNNCQPFTNQRLMFAHNGTFLAMPHLRRKLMQLLCDDLYHFVRGQTDSECFFALIMQNLLNLNRPITAETLGTAYQLALHQVHALERDMSVEDLARVNIVITNGHEMLATRYTSDLKQPYWSLYYTQGESIQNNGPTLIKSPFRKKNMILIASEKLTDNAHEWKLLPINHMLLINKKLDIAIRPIEVDRARKTIL